MANPSKAANGLFGLPATYDPTTAGDRLRARLQRKKELTAEIGAAAANTQLATEAQNEADHIASRITPKVEVLATESQLLRNTAQQVSTLSNSSTQGGAVNSTVAAGPNEEVALGQARMAQYYIQTADNLRGTAQWWGPFIVFLTGLAALLWNWYNRRTYERAGLTLEPGMPDLSRPAWWKTLGIFFALFLGSLFPLEVMQLPRAAISPLVKLVSP